MRWTIVGLLAAGCAGESSADDWNPSQAAAKGESEEPPAQLRFSCIDEACTRVLAFLSSDGLIAAWTVDDEPVGEAASIELIPTVERLNHIQAKDSAGGHHESWMRAMEFPVGDDHVQYDTNVVFFDVGETCSSFEISTVGGCLKRVDELWFHSTPATSSGSVGFDVRGSSLLELGYAREAQWSIGSSQVDMVATAAGTNSTLQTLPGPHFTHWFDLQPGETRHISVEHVLGSNRHVADSETLHCTSGGSPMVGYTGE